MTSSALVVKAVYVGASVGAGVGASVGLVVGSFVGSGVGELVGESVGDGDGCLDGILEGVLLGISQIWQNGPAGDAVKSGSPCSLQPLLVNAEVTSGGDGLVGSFVPQ